MERIVLPLFFSIMVHLLIHLVEEVKLGGPVPFRWMYLFERFFFVLKEYVSNKTYPEGSIAEDYIAEEGITFCSKYLEVHYATFDMHNNNPSTINQSNYLFGSAGTGIGKEEIIVLDEKSLIQIHRFILRHCDQIESYRE
ncbi:hypothetical protein AXF42_Ash017808 [Apostasia shenzhenica]|uniref:DUF4218 domain-containing protein n=1 Tax=Apostasia shenzhenica TaxID=1088818 RepID=A0A2I0A3U5_9ASPA|nr:hypothetical protein AXF42_Ash017808 [Apostasia shenzhenica]